MNMEKGNWFVLAGTLVSAIGGGLVYIGNVLLATKNDSKI